MRYIVSVALMVTGCVSATLPSPFSISYVAEDSPENAKIYVKYTNDSRNNLCIYPTNWPGSDGRIENGKGRVFIEVDGKSYSTEEFDSGYCPGCVLRIEPGQEIIGFFNYEDFGLPQAAYMKDKSLKFSPIATYCSSRAQN